MKTKNKILTGVGVTVPVLIALVVGCSSLKSRHVIDRIPPTTPSVEAVEGGYDTVGRMWSAEELARMRRSREEKVTAAAAPERAVAPVQPAPRPAPAPAVEKPVANNSARDRVATSTINYSSIEIKGGVANLTIRAPEEASVTDTFCYELIVTAVDNVTNVFVEQTLPEDAVYVSSDPKAGESGRLLTWNFTRLSKGEKKTIKVCVKSTKSGPLTSCATVYTKPQYCATTMIGKPVLTMAKTGPDKCLLTSNATFNIVVSNKGDGVARNVVITDPVPDGFAHESGKNILTYDLGNLAPNETKTTSVVLKAVKRGKVCNVAEVVGANAEKTSAEACTTILQSAVKIVKTGAEKQFINKTAAYKIVVSNVGDTDLTGLTVTDTAPAGTSFTTTGTAAVSGTTAVWKNVALKVGEERAFEVSLLNRNKGEHCNVASVTTQSGERQEAKACTMWLGVSALLLEVVDDPDPLLVDETNTYTVRVTNQGTAELTDLGLTATFSKQMQPLSAEKGSVSGQTVKFETIRKLGSKEMLTFKIKAKAVSIGDARIKVSMSSDILETPVTKEESTRVY